MEILTFSSLFVCAWELHSHFSPTLTFQTEKRARDGATIWRNKKTTNMSKKKDKVRVKKEVDK